MQRGDSSMANGSPSVPMLDQFIETGKAWSRDSFVEADCALALDAACLEELDAVADFLAANPLHTLLLKPEYFSLDACRAFWRRARPVLDDGPGVAMISGFPVTNHDAAMRMALMWVFCSLLEPPMAQKWDGTMFYDVTDTGVTLQDGVRGSLTNLDLEFHTDCSFGEAPPDYVALLCIHPAMKGVLQRDALA